ncbi:MAG: hypothetical protein HWE30_04830 [Methylocystaceae bacterium]|nr:hypothetical protein [Methylocystaceae bacterium]
MKKIAMALALTVLPIQSVHADDRQVVNVPSEIKAMFLEEMRGHLDNLNEITLALSAGDFEAAAFVAKNKMGFGHSMREILVNQGMHEAEIDAFMKRMREKHGPGQGRGMGRFMPEELTMMGQEFHMAAENFAEVASSVQSPPTPEDYKNVFTALSETIDVCSACHSTFRVE